VNCQGGVGHQSYRNEFFTDVYVECAKKPVIGKRFNRETQDKE